jgi:kynureninase
MSSFTASSPSISSPLLRERFPILASSTYLASHSLGAAPAATEESLRRYYREWAEQGILAWDGPWWSMIDRFGDSVAKLLGAPSGTIVPMENVTRGFAAIASSLDWTTKTASGKPKNKIVITSLEFITSYPFWQGWSEMVGARLVQVDSRDGISVDAQDLMDAIDEETLLVPTSHVYFRSGAIQDLKRVSEKARSVDAYLLGDGYQAAGIVEMDLLDLGVDFYVGGSHKWLCGGPGAGFLYVRKDLIERLEPKFSGWFGIENPFEYEPTTRFRPAKGIRRFMAGTPSMPALYAAIEGVNTLLEVGMENVRSRSKELTAKIIVEADRRGFEVKTPRDADRRSGMVCVDFPSAKEATDFLVGEKIIVDYRPNCGIRVSPHFYSSEDDLKTFWAGIDRFLNRSAG